MAFYRFWERMAIRILMKSQKITMLAFKDRDLDQVFISANPSDPVAWKFLAQNENLQQDLEPDSMVLERLFHMPDAEKNT
jgi:hypothetical protein